MTKFITPVSMQVTEEQYETDLRDKLLAMGYSEECAFLTSKFFLLVNNLDGSVTNLGFLSYGQHYDYNRHFIPTYNPELFLALAGMTDDKEIKVGDWVYHGGNARRITSGPDEFDCYSVSSKKMGPYFINKNEWRKATKEEIIQHFEGKPGLKEQMNEATEWLGAQSKTEPIKINAMGSKCNNLVTVTGPIFRKGDTVYHWKHGELKVINAYEFSVETNVPKLGKWHIDNRELSFTPYNLKDGGFSQERPGPTVYIVHYEGCIYGCFDTKEKAEEYRNNAAGVSVKKLEVL